MLFVSYNQNSGGRSGHKLKDLFTSVILAHALKSGCVIHPTWKKQKFLPFKRVSQVLLPRRPDYDRIYNFHSPKRYWGGIPKEEIKAFLAVGKALLACQGDTIINLSNVYRVHLSQLHSWENEGICERGTFLSSLKTLREMYWGSSFPETPSEIVRNIAIHVRRGDIYRAKRGKMPWNSVWGLDFYSPLIFQLKAEYPEAQLHIYSEKENSADLRKLSNVELHLGGGAELTQHFRKMVSADIFIPTDSGLSIWAAYLASGHVHVYHADQIHHFSRPEDVDSFRRCELTTQLT